MTSIYSLTDPRDGIIKYIGKTKCEPRKRLAQHLYQWKRDKGRHNKLNSWIKALAGLELVPEMIIEDTCSEEDWKVYEIGYIKLLKACGANLKNQTNGGDEPSKNMNSPEAKLKRIETCKTSEAWQNKGKRHSEIMKQYHKEGRLTFGYGHISDEKRKLIGRRHSIKMKELFGNSDHGRKLILGRIKAVDMVDQEGVIIRSYESVAQASRESGIAVSSIINVCKGRHTAVKNYRFRYSKSY